MPLKDMQPVSGAHSIKNVFFALEWSNPLLAADFESIAKHQPSLAKFYSRVQFTKAITVKIDEGKTSTDVTEISGVVFDNGDPNTDVASTIQVQPNHIVISIPGTSYESWTQVWQLVSSLFAVLLPTILNSRPINVIGLQYQDEFFLNATPTDAALGDFFLADSKYLTAAVIEAKGPWHCHQGFFEYCETPVVHKRLNNINVSVDETLGKTKLQIVMSHRAVLDMEISDTELSPNEKDSPIFAVMRSLHDFDIDTLKHILRSEVLSKIGMES
jgi:uncharacterized protein (TIGR04255 family)